MTYNAYLFKNQKYVGHYQIKMVLINYVGILVIIDDITDNVDLFTSSDKTKQP